MGLSLMRVFQSLILSGLDWVKSQVAASRRPSVISISMIGNGILPTFDYAVEAVRLASFFDFVKLIRRRSSKLVFMSQLLSDKNKDGNISPSAMADKIKRLAITQAG